MSPEPGILNPGRGHFLTVRPSPGDPVEAGDADADDRVTARRLRVQFGGGDGAVLPAATQQPVDLLRTRSGLTDGLRWTAFRRFQFLVRRSG